MERDEVETAIHEAFAGVRLGSGVSLRQAGAIDAYMVGWTPAQYNRLPLSEVTHDWTLVPDEELRRDNVAHLDADGLRYYLPALMLWLLEHYGDRDYEMTWIGTIGALAPSKDFRERMYSMFDTFTEPQRAAIASYVDALRRLVHLESEDANLVERSIRDYWGRFLEA
jgi:hypothetical protein